MKSDYSTLYLSSYLPSDFRILETATGHQWWVQRSGSKYRISPITSKMGAPSAKFPPSSVTLSGSISRDTILQVINQPGIDFESSNSAKGGRDSSAADMIKAVSKLSPQELLLFSALVQDIKDVSASTPSKLSGLSTFEKVTIGQEKYVNSQRISVEFMVLTDYCSSANSSTPDLIQAFFDIMILPFEKPILQMVFHCHAVKYLNTREIEHLAINLKHGLQLKGYSFL